MHFRLAIAYIVHTKTTENADENGGFRKWFRKWSVLKTHRFENAPFLVWIGENGASFENGDENKRHILSFPSAFSGVF